MKFRDVFGLVHVHKHYAVAFVPLTSNSEHEFWVHYFDAKSFVEFFSDNEHVIHIIGITIHVICETDHVSSATRWSGHCEQARVSNALTTRVPVAVENIEYPLVSEGAPLARGITFAIEIGL